MKDILDIAKQAPVIIILVLLIYFLKVFLEKRIEGLSGRIEEIKKVSLSVKKDLRGEERQALVAFRVSLEKWEDFLQRCLFDFAAISPDSAKVTVLYEADSKLFLEVKIAIITVSTYLRNKDLELQLMDTVIKIRKLYYPLIFESLPVLIDIQSELILFDFKLKKFQESGMLNMEFAPTEQDREKNLKLQNAMTVELEKFSQKCVEQYREIAIKIDELKEAVNIYIYRPIKYAEIDME